MSKNSYAYVFGKTREGYSLESNLELLKAYKEQYRFGLLNEYEIIEMETLGYIIMNQEIERFIKNE